MVILPVVVVIERALTPPFLPFIPSVFELIYSLLRVCSFLLPGHMVVPLHPLQWRPDPHKHYPALYAFHVQDAKHEHEA